MYIPLSLKEPLKKVLYGDRTFALERNRAMTLRILETVITILDRHRIRYYLDFGTLLGAMRDRAFIPWDDDADITLFDEGDYDKIDRVLEEINAAGFFTWKTDFRTSIENRKKLMEKDKNITLFVDKIDFTSPDNPRLAIVANRHPLIRSLRGKNNVDIFFKYGYNGSLHWMVKNRLQSIPREILGDELIEIDFYHLKCTIPKNYDAYLTYIYGDWKTPKKDWQYYENETCKRP